MRIFKKKDKTYTYLVVFLCNDKKGSATANCTISTAYKIQNQDDIKQLTKELKEKGKFEHVLITNLVLLKEV